ncbi:MAG: LPP20 family lipoprotein [Pseudomonadota bacterium]
MILERALFSALLASLLLLGACVPFAPLQRQEAPALAPAKPVKVSAVGRGTPSYSHYSQYNQGQQKLMALRAAKLDAFRSLAEQVHGFQLSGATTISAFASQNDYVRVYVEAFVQGARVTEVTALPDGAYEVRVEAELPDDFRACLARGDCPRPPTPESLCGNGGCRPEPACVGTGCAPASGANLNWSTKP